MIYDLLEMWRVSVFIVAYDLASINRVHGDLSSILSQRRRTLSLLPLFALECTVVHGILSRYSIENTV